MDTKYNLERAAQVRAELEQFLKQHPKTKQAHISKALNNVAPGTLTQWMKDAYTGDIDRVTNEVANWLQREREKLLIKNRDEKVIVDTYNFKVIQQIARDCHLLGKIGVVYGDSSLGKTEGVRAYAQRYNDAVLIESEYGYTPKVLVEKIAQGIGLGVDGNFNTIKENVLDALNGSGRLIIVDEAENLPTASLEFLRRIHDKTGIGLLYTGMPRLIYNLRGNKGQFKQLYSRVRFSYKLPTLKPDDVRKILETTDMSEDQIDRGFGIFNKVGKNNLRRLLNTVEEFFRLSSIPQNSDKSEKDLLKMATEMTEV